MSSAAEPTLALGVGVADGVSWTDLVTLPGYERSNVCLKAFVDAGGYTSRQWWDSTIVREGKPLAWEAAMAPCLLPRFQKMPRNCGTASWMMP